MTKHQKFQKWLATFAEEKGLDMSEYVNGKDCTLQVGDVLSAMNSSTESEQAIIKNTMVMIDLKNGDVLHFIKHLAQALGPEHKLGMRVVQA
jgi:hypothetical protein